MYNVSQLLTFIILRVVKRRRILRCALYSLQNKFYTIVEVLSYPLYCHRVSRSVVLW